MERAKAVDDVADARAQCAAVREEAEKMLSRHVKPNTYSNSDTITNPITLTSGGDAIAREEH